jgi:hypothetical protein
MGIGRAAIALLLEEAVARPFYGRLATSRSRETVCALRDCACSDSERWSARRGLRFIGKY